MKHPAIILLKEKKGLKIMKKTVSVLLVLLLLTCLSSTAFAAQDGIQPGDPMPDFTVELCDGSSATLSELLKDHDLVVLNVFATWCGPCKVEFPEIRPTATGWSFSRSPATRMTRPR